MSDVRCSWILRGFLALTLLLACTRSVQAGSITLAWDANPEADITGYIIYYGTASRTYGAEIDVGNVTSYSILDLTDGQQYFFAVTAYNTSRLQSPFSSEITATVDESGIPAVLTAPAPGTTLTASSAHFRWTVGTAVSSYRLSVGSTFGGVNLFDQSELNAVSARVTGLPTDGSTVYVRLWSLVAGMWRFSDYTYTATTTCTFTLSPTSSAVGVTASIGTVSVTAPRICSRTATSDVSWITVIGGETGAGSGTVTYSVAATTSTSARTGTLTIEGSTVTVTQAAVSRIISLSGALTFVPMQAGMTATKTLTIGNSGNSVLMVTGITYPAGFSGNWPGGPIAPGASRAVTVAFTPMAALAYTGTVTVEGNQTSGTDTTAVSGISTGFVLMQDSFTGSDGSLLTAHAADVKPVGAAWTVNGGSPVPALQNGMVGVAAGSGHLQATLDTRVSDIVMSVDYRAGTGPGMGALAFRLTDAENHLLLLTYLNQLQLYRRQKAAYTLLATAPLSGALVPDATHRLEVRATGTMIEGWWDGARILAIAEAFQQTATRHGIDFNSAFDATSKYDNLIASAAAAPAMPGVPGTPGPGTGAIDVGTATPLTWSETAATTSYDVKFGTTDPPVTTTNVATASWTPMLATGTTYYWQVIARNTAGTTAGPVWSFTTAASEPGVVVQDSFTEPSSTALVGHIPDVTPVGTGWVLNGGAPGPTLQNGAVGITPGTGHTPVTIETGVSNIRLTVDYKVGSGAGMGGVVLRLTDANNFLVLLTYANELQLHKRQAGGWTLLASAPLPAALVGETKHRLEVRATGSLIEGWWDGVRKLQAIEPFQQTATRHGLDWNSAYDATSTYDNFVVSANGAGVPPTSGPIGPSPGSR